MADRQRTNGLSVLDQATAGGLCSGNRALTKYQHTPHQVVIRLPLIHGAVEVARPSPPRCATTQSITGSTYGVHPPHSTTSSTSSPHLAEYRHPAHQIIVLSRVARFDLAAGLALGQWSEPTSRNSHLIKESKTQDGHLSTQHEDRGDLAARDDQTQKQHLGESLQSHHRNDRQHCLLPVFTQRSAPPLEARRSPCPSSTSLVPEPLLPLLHEDPLASKASNQRSNSAAKSLLVVFKPNRRCRQKDHSESRYPNTKACYTPPRVVWLATMYELGTIGRSSGFGRCQIQITSRSSPSSLRQHQVLRFRPGHHVLIADVYTPSAQGTPR